jgi:hypothetical protein
MEASELSADNLTARLETGVADRERALDLAAISRTAFVTALALALPVVFHAFRLGHVFLPMYLPILAGAFFLSWRSAAASGFAAPLLSAAVTGMPPLFPPVAIWMSFELSLMGALVSWLDRRRLPAWLTILTALVVGRACYAGLVFLTGRWLGLPAGAYTLISLLAGWPGMALAVIAIPAAVALVRRGRGER